MKRKVYLGVVKGAEGNVRTESLSHPPHSGEGRYVTEKEKLNLRNIYNTFDLAKLGDGVFIYWCHHDSRSCLPDWWAVSKIGINLGDDWYDSGNKTFSGGFRDAHVKVSAFRFASKIAKCNSWVRTPFGDYVSTLTANKIGLRYKYVLKVIPDKSKDTEDECGYSLERQPQRKKD